MNLKEYIYSKKELVIGMSVGLLLMLVLVMAFFYVPSPTMDQKILTTKGSNVTLSGKVRPGLGVVVFDKAGNALLVVNATDKGEFTLSDIPVGEGNTELTVRALSSAWRVSFPQKIKVTQDTTSPSLSVQDLQSATVTGSNTVVSGKAEPGTTVTVNGVKTTVSGDGTWNAVIALKPGSNPIEIIATDAAGNATTHIQTIQYTPTAEGSPTGVATVTTSTVSLSPGSLPASSVAATATTTKPTTAVVSTTTKPATTVPTTPTQTQPAVTTQPVLAITSSAWVSNASPNQRSNETVYVSVKDNYGRPVTDATVTATVYFKTGNVSYNLRHNGSGQYSVSFKLNDKYTSGYKVSLETIARYSGFVSAANTTFTPQ